MSVITFPGPGVYPSGSLYPSSGLDVLAIRERPPLRLAIDVETPDGKHYRWGPDEHDPANAPANLLFSSTMPGGFEQASCTLARKPGRDYADLAEFSTLTAHGAGGAIAWQGRLQTAPRTSGDQLAITPGAVGLQAHLDDNKSAQMIYVDADLTQWQPASVQRKINLLNSSWGGVEDPNVAPDQTTGVPSVVTQLTGPWAAQRICEAWYDGNGVALGAIYFAWKKTSTIDATDANWAWNAGLPTDDIYSAGDTTASQRGTGPSSGSESATASNRVFAALQLLYTGAKATDGTAYPIFWQLAVVGNHGLPISTGNGAFASAPCVLASDVVAHAIATWAPKLSLSRAGVSTIEATTFAIPHLTFKDPTTASAIVKGALAFELQDWWVDEGPTFNTASRANHGRDWRARVGPSGLQETGPQVDRMCNRVLVAYRDVTGATRTVGPTGSGADTIDDSLADTDPANPVTAAGLEIYPPTPPTLGTSTAPAAIRVGQLFLAEARQLSTAGQAQIVGHVEDDRGVLWPAWAIRAGDRITFLDAHDPVPRRVVKASYSDSSKACQIDLDSPPEGLSALLARMGGVLAPLGFS